MATQVIKVPDIGEGIAEVELVEWHVGVGDAVAEDQPLAGVMTDKASVEIPSPVAGKVLALGGELGQMLAVGAELIRIETTGGDEAAVEAKPQPAASPVAPAKNAPARQPAPPPSVKTATSRVAPPSRATTTRPIASPSVRRRAWELGIKLEDVKPSGTAGRITHADIDALGKRATAAQGSTEARYAARDDATAIPVIGLRRRIAQKMQDAKRRIPHFAYVEEVDVTEIEALRARLNAKWKDERAHLTLLPLLVRALVLAVREYPQLNARFDDEAGVVTRHGAVHVGIATQTAHGLIVPVLRHAESRDPWASATEIARLAEAARAGHATRDELAGSTITITSLGALGGIVSTPVINAPEVAIVGVNRIVERPMYQRGALVPRLVMNLSSSFDHRVVDGVDAARFVQALRERLECPALLFAE
jgi:2-oxoisovalerate dehydrogenase E2 component (dihydrolipoyl transacylase)